MRRSTGIFWNKSFARMPWRDSVAIRLTGFKLMLFGHLAGALQGCQRLPLDKLCLWHTRPSGLRVGPDYGETRRPFCVPCMLGSNIVSGKSQPLALININPFFDYHYDYVGTREPTALYWCHFAVI
jgi:hypothetical protein